VRTVKCSISQEGAVAQLVEVSHHRSSIEDRVARFRSLKNVRVLKLTGIDFYESQRALRKKKTHKPISIKVCVKCPTIWKEAQNLREVPRSKLGSSNFL
jgi:hypothetical protein